MYRFWFEHPRRISSLDIAWSFISTMTISIAVCGQDCELPQIVDENAPVESRLCMFGLGLFAAFCFFWRYKFIKNMRFELDTFGMFSLLFLFLFFVISLFHSFISYISGAQSLPTFKVFFYEAFIMSGMLHVPIMHLSEIKQR